MVHTPEGPSSKFEADAKFVQKLLKGSQNLEIRSRDPGHADFGVIL